MCLGKVESSHWPGAWEFGERGQQTLNEVFLSDNGHAFLTEKFMSHFHSNMKPLKTLEQGNVRTRAALNLLKAPMKFSGKLVANKNDCPQMILEDSAKRILRKRFNCLKLYHLAIRR